MKKPIHILLVSILSITLLAQNNLAVKSFVKVQNDMTARIDYPKKDQNGDVCAIIKVETTQTGFSWEPDGLGIMAAVPQVGEYWLYVPYGAKRLTIKHPVLGILRDYIYPLPIEKATVYVMTLVTGKVITTVEETIESQWLVITPEPADAAVYINDVNANTGVYQNKLKPGSYIYRVEAPLYHSEVGKVEVTNDKKELNVKLKPAFGYITINTEPEKDAKVIIDGKTLTTNTPTKSEALASGEHTVQVMKDMYQPSAQKVTVTDGQITPVSFTMQPNFAELTVTLPAEATLYINNQQKATTNWTGRLNAGVYSLEARLDKHRPAKQDIELTAGDIKKIDLQPTPIYGSLDVISSPTGANITINGKEYGTTPNTIKSLLIGDYIVSLSKMGYENISKKVNIKDGESNEIIDTLQFKKNTWSKTSPIELNLTKSKTKIQLIENTLLGNQTISLSENSKFNGGQNNTIGNSTKKPLIGDYTQGFGKLGLNNTRLKTIDQAVNDKIITSENKSNTSDFNPKEKIDNSAYITIKSNGLYGCVDKKGNVIIPTSLSYLFVGQFSNDGIAPVVIKYVNGSDQLHNWGIINLSGELISKNLKYRYINTFSEGLAWVVLNDKIGCIDKTGKVVVPIIYDQQSCGEGMWCDDIFINGTKIVSLNNKYLNFRKLYYPACIRHL